jgi:hypothetical protein
MRKLRAPFVVTASAMALASSGCTESPAATAAPDATVADALDETAVDEDAPVACPTSCEIGAACDVPTSQRCACNDEASPQGLYCTRGIWCGYVQNPPGPFPGDCPDAFPVSGSSCSSTFVYEVCDYSCGIAVCDHGIWCGGYVDPDASDCVSNNPPPCPTTPPVAGSACPTGLRGFDCRYHCAEDAGAYFGMDCDFSGWREGFSCAGAALDGGVDADGD